MRRYVTGLLLVMMLVVIFALPVAAGTDDYDKASQKIEDEISKAITKGEKFNEKGFDADSKQIKKAADKLVEKTDKIVDKLENKAEDGDTIVREYITIDVGGISVEVDPFHVF